MRLVVKSLIGEQSVKTRITNQFNKEACNKIMEEVTSTGQSNWLGKVALIHGQCDRYYIIASSKYKRLFEEIRRK